MRQVERAVWQAKLCMLPLGALVNPSVLSYDSYG